MTTIEQCPIVVKVLGKAVADLREVDGSRHETARDAAAALARLGGEGHRGVRQALVTLGTSFETAVGSERIASGEWRRLLSGAVKLAAADNAAPRQSCPDDVLTAYTGPEGFDLAASIPPITTSFRQGGRRMDLGPYLDGTFEAPEPAVGAIRDDGAYLLYAGKWHTLIAPTETGKSLWAAWHVAAELFAGRTVIYAHFEEAGPEGTIGRLLAMGVSKDAIRERFVWYDCSTAWAAGEFAGELFALRGPFGPTSKADNRPTLLVLDGINAACSQHMWPVDKPEAVGSYRSMFVSPATSEGMAVVSLGHPPKARGREDERHGFGSTAWLDEVDGVGFRLLPVKEKRIMLGQAGMATLHVVKDRYGSVSKSGLYRDDDAEGWRYMGAFIVDSTSSTTKMRLSVPREDDTAEQGPDATDRLADDIVSVLREADDCSYPGVRALEAMLRAAKVRFDKGLVSEAVYRLVSAKRLEIVQSGQRIGGRLADGEAAQDATPSQ